MARQSVYMHVLLSEVDNGEEFFVKIPVDGLLYCIVNLCEGSMTTRYLKVLPNSDVSQQLLRGFCTLYRRTHLQNELTCRM